MELRNDEKTYSLVLKFIELREKLGDNLIKVKFDENKFVVYVKEKVVIEGVEVKSLKDVLKESLLNLRGVKEVEIEDSHVKIYVSQIYPELFELVSVTIYEIEKEFGEKIEWEIVEIT